MPDRLAMTRPQAFGPRACDASSSGKQRGMTLIEVLVSVVILSVGLLAAVGLQLVSKRNNSDAAQRTLAARMAGDMIERMRSNKTSTGLKAYVSGGSALGGKSIATEPSPNCSSSAPCTNIQAASHDLWAWETEMDGAFEKVTDGSGQVNVGGLAFPTGCITGPGDGGSGIYTVTVAWRGGVEIPDNAAIACGKGKANYGASGEYRRTVSLQVYIAN